MVTSKSMSTYRAHKSFFQTNFWKKVLIFYVLFSEFKKPLSGSKPPRVEPPATGLDRVEAVEDLKVNFVLPATF